MRNYNYAIIEMTLLLCRIAALCSVSQRKDEGSGSGLSFKMRVLKLATWLNALVLLNSENVYLTPVINDW